jgi:hypothetical protein
MSPIKDTTKELTRPMKAVTASASPPGMAFGPKIVSSRTEAATNNKPMSAAEAVASAAKYESYTPGTMQAEVCITDP